MQFIFISFSELENVSVLNKLFKIPKSIKYFIFDSFLGYKISFDLRFLTYNCLLPRPKNCDGFCAQSLE